MIAKETAFGRSFVEYIALTQPAAGRGCRQFSWEASKVKALNQKNPKVYRPVGRCVYCGRDGSPDGLSTEHIVAYGLTGSGLLPKASCASCRDITGQIEQTCLRVNFIDYRVHGKLATRRPKERPTVLPVRLTIDGKTHTQHVPVDQHPALLYMPVLPKPGIFAGIGPSSELRVSTMFCAYDPNEVKTKLEASHRMQN
jgi:hypothetical protein